MRTRGPPSRYSKPSDFPNVSTLSKLLMQAPQEGSGPFEICSCAQTGAGAPGKRSTRKRSFRTAPVERFPKCLPFGTDAISDLLRLRPLPLYVEWLKTISRDAQFTSVVTVGELFKGA